MPANIGVVITRRTAASATKVGILITRSKCWNSAFIGDTSDCVFSPRSKLDQVSLARVPFNSTCRELSFLKD